MVNNRTGFEQIADDVSRLAKYQELFDSSSKLMTDALVNDGVIYAVSGAFCSSAAKQFCDFLAGSPDDTRPPLPAQYLCVDTRGQRQFDALLNQNDFAVFFGDPTYAPILESLLDTCLEKGVASLLICPDLNHIESTDKALEIRLEYSSFSDYSTSLSAVSNYLTRSIEMLLFGRQV